MKQVRAAEMREWAEVLRDPNPIHLDSAAVAAKGLGDRVINQGPANLAYIVTRLQAAYPGARLLSLDVRYLDNVFAGDVVEAAYEVVSTEGRRVTLDVALKVAGRNPAIQGSVVLES